MSTGITVEVSDMERRSLEVIVQESQKLGRHPLPLPSEAEAHLAFGLADDILSAVNKMRKSIARDKSVRDAQGLLRITAASVVYGQMVAVRENRERRAMATAPADMPIAYHAVMVECFHDGTFKARVEQGAIEYRDGVPVGTVGVHAFAPSAERRTADEAAQDVLIGARMLSKSIADTKLEVVG